MDKKYTKKEIQDEFERIKAELKKHRPKFEKKSPEALHKAKLERLKKLDPNFSKEYENLSADELQQKIRNIQFKKFANPKSFLGGKDKKLGKTTIIGTTATSTQDPTASAAALKAADMAPAGPLDLFLPTIKCKHEKTVVNDDFPGSSVCTECGLVIKPNTGNQKGVALIDDKRHKMPHPKEISSDIHREIQKSSDIDSEFNCIKPSCPSFDIKTGKGAPMKKIRKTYTDSDGKIHEYFMLQCPICSHTREDGNELMEGESYTGHVIDHNIIGQVQHKSKHELLEELRKLDPQYDINKEKYQLLESSELEDQVIALEKNSEFIKKNFPKLGKIETDREKARALLAARGIDWRKWESDEKSSKKSDVMDAFGLEDDFDEDSIEFDSDSDSDSEDEEEDQRKLRQKILRLKQKAVALGLPGAGSKREKGKVDYEGVEKVLAEVAKLEAKLKPIKKIESLRNTEAIKLVMELHNLYSNKNKVSFRENEKRVLTKLSNLIGKSSLENLDLGKMEESGVDLNTIILPKTLIFAPKNDNKELLDLWKKGEDDAYNNVISDLEGESLKKRAIYNEARNYVLESIRLLENLVNIIISLKNGIIPEIDLIREGYFKKIIENKNWVLYVIRKYVRDVRDLTRKRTKVLEKLDDIDNKDSEKTWFQVLSRINKKLNTTQEIPQKLYPYRKLKSGKVVPRNAVQWTFWKEKITLVDPETGKVIEGGLKQIHTEGKPLKKLINNKCYLIQKRRPWIGKFKGVLISPVEYNEKYKQFLLGKVIKNCEWN